MRQKVIKEKKFLHQLYKAKDLKLIELATIDQLKALLTAIHLVINKKVPITKKIVTEFLKLKKRTISDLKKYFQQPEDFSKLLKLDRAQITKLIRKFFDQIHLTLSPYFELQSRKKRDYKDSNFLT